jgi:hypothetical protein
MSLYALTYDIWAPYQDRYGLIHTIAAVPGGESQTGNGLFYTAIACTIMQLKKRCLRSQRHRRRDCQLRG